MPKSPNFRHAEKASSALEDNLMGTILKVRGKMHCYTFQSEAALAGAREWCDNATLEDIQRFCVNNDFQGYGFIQDVKVDSRTKRPDDGSRFDWEFAAMELWARHCFQPDVPTEEEEAFR